MTAAEPASAGPPSTGARLRTIVPAADVVAAKLRQRVRASLAGRHDEVRVGRYRLGDRLGAGGMGTVYRGRDDQLERDVAIKLVPLPPGTEPARAIREARAMAGVVHPNVVQVFDVGMRGSELYIVMQLWEGSTLRAWAEPDRGAEPTQGSLLAALLAAGEGLAAAHEAGIVHHDFKPDNVLVSSDGRVAVTDFGLAAVRDVTEDGDADRIETEDGPIGGTRGYAAPERHAGAPGDARSDQFSWCVSAVELLCGFVPAAGARVPARSERPGVGRLPLPLRRALQRGLAEDPHRRFPHLRALLEACCRPAPRRRLTTAVLVGTLGIGSAAVLTRPQPLAAVTASDPAPSTPNASDREPDPDEQRLLEALDASDDARGLGDPPRALREARRATELVDSRGLEAWRAEAMLAEGRALEMLGRNDEAAAQLTAAIEVAQTHGDDALAGRAASALSWVLGVGLHQPDEARRWAKSALVYVERGGDLHDVAAIHYSLGSLATDEGELDAAREHFEAALDWDHGELGGDLRSIALSHMALGNLDLQQGYPDAAREHLEQARVLLLDVEDGEQARAAVHSLLGQLEHIQARYEEALQHFDTAAELFEAISPHQRALALSNAARVLGSAGRPREAITRATEALELLEAEFGDTSIETTTPLAVLSGQYRHIGDLEQAERLAWRTVVVLESAGRADSPSIAGPLYSLGNIAIERGHGERGIGYLERSLEIRRRHSVRPAAIAATLMGIARGRAQQGQRAEAIARAREAVEVLEAAGEDASEARRFIDRPSRRAAAP